MHWLYVHAGIPGSGPWYGFWSGFGSDLAEITLLGGVIAVYRKHTCHQRWCWRFGRHDLTDPVTGMVHSLCRRHHPGHPGRALTAAAFAKIVQQRGVTGGG